MFDNKQFENWLDLHAQKAMEKVTSSKPLETQDIIFLTLKAQTNHIAHLDQDLRGEMKALREDMDKRFQQVDKRFEQVDKRFEQVNKRFEQVDRRFERMQANMDKRFEQVDKRFERMQANMDKRFEAISDKMDNFMKWSFGTLLAFSGIIIGVIKYL